MSIDPDGFRPLPLPSERAEAAHAEAEALLAEANRMHNEARDNAERVVSSARTEATAVVTQARQEAQRIRDVAQAEQTERQQRDDKLDTWAARAIIAGTVGLTASGEYALARMVGFDRSVAWLLPFVIDVYVIQAFRRHRDIVQAISLTVAANVTYHLADKGLFGVEAVRERHEPQWWLIAMVASVASLILWRVHLMTAPEKPVRDRRQRRQKQRQDTPAVAPTPPPAQPTQAATSGDSTTANSDRQDDGSGAANNRQKTTAKKAAPAAKKAAPAGRQNTARKPGKKAASTRRSMDEWVQLTEPIFHAEFARLRRNPTAAEFANAIDKAGHGRPSDSTAKNIRTEVLDRAELPSLEDTE